MRILKAGRDKLLEMLLLGLLASAVCTRDDIKFIIRCALRLQAFYNKLKSEMLDPIIAEVHSENQFFGEFDQINSYIKKIEALGFVYQGRYDLTSVKAKYFEILKNIDIQ